MPVLETNLLSNGEIETLLSQGEHDAQFRHDVQCPVDPDHVFDVSRIRTHLADCRRVRGPLQGATHP